METKEYLESKTANNLKAGTCALLEAKSGIPYEDLYQYFYIQNERNSGEPSQRQSDLLNFLEALVMIKNLIFKKPGVKSASLIGVYGLLCSGKARVEQRRRNIQIPHKTVIEAAVRGLPTQNARTDRRCTEECN
jgi:hypothetical protein